MPLDVAVFKSFKTHYNMCIWIYGWNSSQLLNQIVIDEQFVPFEYVVGDAVIVLGLLSTSCFIDYGGTTASPSTRYGVVGDAVV